MSQSGGVLEQPAVSEVELVTKKVNEQTVEIWVETLHQREHTKFENAVSFVKVTCL